MKKKWLLVPSLVMALVVAGVCGCAQGTSAEDIIPELALSLQSQQSGIWVTSSGEVPATPDLLTLRLGIEAQQATVAEAQAEAAEAMNSVMNALTESGIAENDIQTQRYSISQRTRWDPDEEKQVIIGYQVTNMVTVKIRDIDGAGSVIDAVVEAGGDLTRIDSLYFSVEDPSTYQEEARAKAMADAKDKAEQLADLAGVSLGTATYISEDTQIPSPVYLRDVYYADEAAVVQTPISAGEVEVSVTVQVAYAILD